jgi:NTP pyrophosphatase (non-canonical NTP hydrolase)
MNNQQYVVAAHRTMSPGFHGELVAKDVFIAALNEAILALQRIDKIKKAFFYGRALPEDMNGQGMYRNCENIRLNLPENEDAYDPTLQERLIHGILGKSTESGELLESLLLSVTTGEPPDFVNIGEEIGDGMWYDAILLKCIDRDIEQIQEQNIAKLRARFPNKFTEEAAENRDLAAERKILEAPASVMNTEARHLLEKHNEMINAPAKQYDEKGAVIK